MHIIIFGLEVVCDVRHGGALEVDETGRGCNIFPQSRLTGQPHRADRQGEGVHRLHALYLTTGRNWPGSSERVGNARGLGGGRGSLLGGGRANGLGKRKLYFRGLGLLRCGHHSGRLIQSKIPLSLMHLET